MDIIQSKRIRAIDWSVRGALARAFEALREQARKRSSKIQLEWMSGGCPFVLRAERTASGTLALQSGELCPVFK